MVQPQIPWVKLTKNLIRFHSLFLMLTHSIQQFNVSAPSRDKFLILLSVAHCIKVFESLVSFSHWSINSLQVLFELPWISISHLAIMHRRSHSAECKLSVFLLLSLPLRYLVNE
jgi:hypothetical protein